MFKLGKKQAQREREYLNRSVKTVVFDKTHVSRTSIDGGKSFRPKRDQNGIIQCKSQIDQESCIYADNVRAIRQREYDNIALYSTADAEQAEYVEKSKENFIDFVSHVIVTRHANSSKSIVTNWERLYDKLKDFVQGDYLPFSSLNLKLMEDFKNFLLESPCGGNRKGKISKNTAGTYFAIFKAALKQAFVDGYLSVDLSGKMKGIKSQESRREFLTIDELNRLAEAPCDPLLKRAALFSALTGLRHSDIQKLKWSEVEEFNGGYRLNFTQQKTKGVEYMPISKQAYELCGERKDHRLLVFAGLPDPSWINRPVYRWVEAAGITKRITFHCFRHTYATLQLANGTDIYTVSKMLGHTNVRTTQIYAKVVDDKKEQTTGKIQINLPSFD